MEHKYSWKKTIVKGAKAFSLFTASMVVMFAPQINDLSIIDALHKLVPALSSITIGSMLLMVENWAKHS